MALFTLIPDKTWYLPANKDTDLHKIYWWGLIHTSLPTQTSASQQSKILIYTSFMDESLFTWNCYAKMNRNLFVKVLINNGQLYFLLVYYTQACSKAALLTPVVCEKLHRLPVFANDFHLPYIISSISNSISAAISRRAWYPDYTNPNSKKSLATKLCEPQ